MAVDRNIQIDGRKLAALRKQEYMTQRKLAEVLGVATGTVTNYEQNERVGMLVEVFKKLAELLKLSPDELKDRIGAGANGTPSGLLSNEADTSVIPEWSIDLRASHWASVPIAELDYDDPAQREIVNRGKFRLTILGQCMAPTYPDRAIVEFQILRLDDPYPLYRDYAVCKSDGTATFKRLQAVDEDDLVLAALNQKDFPGELRVARQEISRVAIAVGLVLPAPEAVPVKVRKGGRSR